MTETRTIIYRHPADLDGEPELTGGDAMTALAEAALVFAKHADAAVKQARSSFLSQQLADDPDATPKDLAAAWRDSSERRLVELLERSAETAQRASQGLRDRLLRNT